MSETKLSDRDVEVRGLCDRLWEETNKVKDLEAERTQLQEQYDLLKGTWLREEKALIEWRLRFESAEAKLTETNFLVEHYNNSFKVQYERAEKAEKEREEVRKQLLFKLGELSAKNDVLESEGQRLGTLNFHLRQENADFEAKWRGAEAEKLIDSIMKILNYRFGIGWIEQEFNASNYESGDSINACDDIASRIREMSLSGFRIKEAES